MARKIEVEEIIGLLQKGFKERVISFELHLPIEYVKECKRQLDKRMEIKKVNQQNAQDAQKNLRNKTKITYKQIKDMKEKYHELKNRDMFAQEAEEIKKVPQSEEEKKKSEKAINKIKDKIEEISIDQKEEKNNSIQNILQSIKRVGEYNLTIEQYKKIMDLVDSLNNIHFRDKTIYKSIVKAKNRIIRKLLDEIDLQVKITDNEEELQILKDKLPKVKGVISFAVDTSRMKIDNKINRLKSRRIDEKETSQNVIKIAESLADGEFDYEQAIQEIETEARYLVSTKPKSKFSLTEEQQKTQVVSRICKELIQNADKYAIRDCQQVINNLNSINGGNKCSSVRVIVHNLIGRRKYEQAYKICDENMEPIKSMNDLNNPNNKYIQSLKKDVISKQLSEKVMEVIESDMYMDSAINVMTFVEDTMKKERLGPGAIKLGNTADGLTTITLGDIYTFKSNKKNKIH